MSNDKINTKVFDEIYKANAWGDRDSRSGTGSNLNQTVEIRRALPLLLREFRTRTMLDIPCGDFYWMKEIRDVLSETIDSYVGGDIVEALVQSNNKMFASSKFSFETLDLINSPLPKVDLIFCRDCLVHLSYRDILSAIRNMRHSGSNYLLTTSFNGATRINTNVPTGGWRPLNLQKFPFSFSEPTKILIEKCTEDGGIYSDKTLMLWRMKDLNTNKLWLNIYVGLVIGLFRRLIHKLVR